MKKHLIIGLLLSLSLSIIAQRVVEHPYVASCTDGNLTLDKVEANQEGTYLTFTYRSQQGWWFTVPKISAIIYGENKKRLEVKAISDGLQLDDKIHQDSTGQTTYTLTFPAIPEDIKEIDFDEGKKGNWKMFGIALYPKDKLSYLPNPFVGNWALDNGKNQWLITIDKLLIYKGEAYKTPRANKSAKGIYTITLNDDTLHLQMRGGTLWLGENEEAMQACKALNMNSPSQGIASYPIPPFELKMDTAYYYGYLCNYNPTMAKTGYVGVDNILTHEQEKHLINVEPSGWFEIKIPTYYPHEVYFRMPGRLSFSTYIVPGERITQIIKGRGTKSAGKYAAFNDEYKNIRYAIRSYDYQKIRKEIDHMSSEAYQNYCKECYQNDLEKWKSFCQRFKYNDDIKAIGNRNIRMNYIQNLWSFSMKKSSHQYKMKKEGKTYTYEDVDSSYFSLLFDLPIDKDEMLGYSNFSSIINRIEYATWLRPGGIIITNEELISSLKENGITLTPEENELIRRRDEYLNSAIFKDYIESKKNDMPSYQAFYNKYNKQIQQFRNQLEQLYPYENYNLAMKDYLMQDKSAKLSKQEIQLLDKLAAKEPKGFAEKNYDFQTKTMNEYVKLSNNYQNLTRQTRNVRWAKQKSKAFLDYTGDRGQLWSDIIVSRALCPNTKKMETLYPSTLNAIDTLIKSQFIKDYIVQSNEKVKQEIELNRTKTGYKEREVPKTKGDKLFDEMIKPFRGKVVYIDFWATWCGPCRSGMEQIKPLKEELKKCDDIVFLYITNQTSPEQTYKNMIPNIKGEHYRVSQDEWNYLTTKFKVSGIPHYLLVDKTGKVVNNNNQIRAGDYMLKDKLMKYIDEK